MAELVYPPVIVAAKTLFRLLDLRIMIDGADNIPRTGPAVLASNHVSYLDFIFCGFAAQPVKRLVRFMAKKEVFDNRVSGPLMRGMHHIPVDRSAGETAYQDAMAALRGGEVVGVFPEATISQSLTVKHLKSGAARMAGEASAPLIPMAVWGAHRLWTKGRPRELTKRHVPVSILIGEAMHPEPGQDVTPELKVRMAELLDKAQRNYPDSPKGTDDTWWLPLHLGGTAPAPPE